MSKFIDITGQRFGRLTVLGLEDRHPVDNRITWHVKCECGVQKTVVGSSNLRKGLVVSCGCYLKEVTSKPKGHAAFNRVYGNYRSSATAKRRVFDLSKDDFRKLVTASCHYCGTPPSTVGRAKIVNKRYIGNGDFLYNGLDRIDNSGGYTQGNVVTCCIICNHAKHNKTYAEFLQYLARLVGYRTEKCD